MKSGLVNAVLYEWGEHISIHTLQIQCQIWVEFGIWDPRAEVIAIGNCENIFWGKILPQNAPGENTKCTSECNIKNGTELQYRSSEWLQGPDVL